METHSSQEREDAAAQGKWREKGQNPQRLYRRPRCPVLLVHGGAEWCKMSLWLIRKSPCGRAFRFQHGSRSE